MNEHGQYGDNGVDSTTISSWNSDDKLKCSFFYNFIWTLIVYFVLVACMFWTWSINIEFAKDNLWYIDNIQFNSITNMYAYCLLSCTIVYWNSIIHLIDILFHFQTRTDLLLYYYTPIKASQVKNMVKKQLLSKKKEILPNKQT
jgi:hypothetical protein